MGTVTTIPNQRIMLNKLALQAAKEVLRYREALDVGWRLVAEHGLLRTLGTGVMEKVAPPA